jgi:hypothetical protein
VSAKTHIAIGQLSAAASARRRSPRCDPNPRRFVNFHSIPVEENLPSNPIGNRNGCAQ